MFSSTVLKNLIELQRAVTPNATWRAGCRLMQAAMPAEHVLMGLPSLGVQPVFMRTTVDIPNLTEFFVRVAQLTPLRRVLLEQPGIPVARMSDVYEAHPGCPFYEECLRPMGWLHSAAMLFWREGGYIGQLSTVRTPEQGDYTDAEIGLLRELHPHVEAAVMRLLELERSGAAWTGLERSMSALPLPLALLDWNLDVVYMNASGREAATLWKHGVGANRRWNSVAELPLALREVCEDVKHAWLDGVRRGDFGEVVATVSVMHPEVAGLTAKVQLLEAAGGGKLRPSFAIGFSTPRLNDQDAGHAVEALSRLTRSEQRVALLASTGRANDAIAKELGVSPNTVRAHLRKIFKKLGIAGRARLGPLQAALEQLASGATVETPAASPPKE